MRRASPFSSDGTRRAGVDVAPSPWAPLRWSLVLLVAVSIVSVAGFMIVERWSFIDSVYMTLMMLTTVGFGEVHELDTSGKVLATAIMAAGVGIVLVTFGLAARAVGEGGFGELSRRRRMQRRIDDLKDHFIICAYGRVGRAVAREFEAEGVPFVVVDAAGELEDRMRQDGVAYVIADPSSEKVLTSLGIERARGLVCAVDSDAVNVYITLAARSLNPSIFIVARASESVSADRLYRAGADRVISPYVSSGRHMAMMSLRPQLVDYLDVGTRGDTNLRLEELQVNEGSELVGRELTIACGKSLPLALRRSNGEIIASPDPSTRLRAGDLLVLLGERDGPA